jgi:hypothetical protein
MFVAMTLTTASLPIVRVLPGGQVREQASPRASQGMAMPHLGAALPIFQE